MAVSQKILQNTPDFRALAFHAQTDLHARKENYSMFKRQSVSELPRYRVNLFSRKKHLMCHQLFLANLTKCLGSGTN